jgi:hypothetical protein
MKPTLLLGICVYLSACGGSQASHAFQFQTSSITPAAVGKVATVAGPNGNTRLTVDVQHLAPPDRVSPGARVYVVWATELGGGATASNLGALRVDDALNGRLESVTPLHSFDLHITAEETPTVEKPTTVSVLSVRVTPKR